MRRWICCACAMLILLTAGCGSRRTEKRALERLEAYAQAIDYSYREPEKIYAFLTREFREQMSQEEFVQAFAKERSYPYITPLYISRPQVQLAEDGMSGTAVYVQAARIEGMHYEVSLVYEDGDYYIRDWDSFLDGSYLDKFADTPYSLDWYYDVDQIGN